MATLKPPPPLPNATGLSNFRNERSVKRSIKPAQQVSLRRSERLAKQRVTKTQLLQTVSSSSNSAESSPNKMTTASSRRWQQPKATLTPKEPQSRPHSEPPDPAQPSFFEALTSSQLARALSYYYYFPQNLPYRESGAFGKANGPTPQVRIKFDEDIFSRMTRLRPVPDDALESVDPFMI